MNEPRLDGYKRRNIHTFVAVAPSRARTKILETEAIDLRNKVNELESKLDVVINALHEKEKAAT